MGKSTRKNKKKRGGGGGSSGGTMSSLRGGFRGIVGVGGKKSSKPESFASKILTYVLLAAAIGMLIYRFTR